VLTVTISGGNTQTVDLSSLESGSAAGLDVGTDIGDVVQVVDDGDGNPGIPFAPVIDASEFDGNLDNTITTIYKLAKAVDELEVVGGSFAFDTFPVYEDSAHSSGIAVNATTLAIYSTGASKWLTASLTDSLDPAPVALSADVYWDGTESTNTYATISGGTITGTQTGGTVATGDDGVEFQFTGSGQKITWTITNFDETKGTFWFDFYTETAPNADLVMAEISGDAQNSIGVILRANGVMRAAIYSDTSNTYVQSDVNPAVGEWHRIGISYDLSDVQGDRDLASTYDSYDWASNVKETAVLNGPDFTTTPNIMSAGPNLNVLDLGSSGENYKIRKMYYIAGEYKADHPLGENL
jgi:hypothetical protein